MVRFLFWWRDTATIQKQNSKHIKAYKMFSEKPTLSWPGVRWWCFSTPSLVFIARGYCGLRSGATGITAVALAFVRHREVKLFGLCRTAQKMNDKKNCSICQKSMTINVRASSRIQKSIEIQKNKFASPFGVSCWEHCSAINQSICKSVKSIKLVLIVPVSSIPFSLVTVVWDVLVLKGFLFSTLKDNLEDHGRVACWTDVTVHWMLALINKMTVDVCPVTRKNRYLKISM